MPEASVSQLSLFSAQSEVHRVISIFVENGLDKPVQVQIYANRTKTANGGLRVVEEFTVGPYMAEAKTLDPAAGWLPYIYCTARCSTPPTYGSLTIYRIRSKLDEVKLFDAVEIRDTETHTSDVCEW